MCDHKSGTMPYAPLISSELMDLVLEDRAEIVPFRQVGEVADVVSAMDFALTGWRVEMALIARNADDPALQAVAAAALDRPDANLIWQLRKLTAGTPRSAAVHGALAELVIAHLDVIFGGRDG